MATIAFRRLLSRWTVAGATSKAAAILPQQAGRASWVPSSRRSFFGLDKAYWAEARRRLDHDSYMKLAEQEHLRLDRCIRYLTSGLVVTGIGLFFVNIHARLISPSTRRATTSSVP